MKDAFYDCDKCGTEFEACHCCFDSDLEKIAKLEEQNKIMREALEFYADINSWTCADYDLNVIIVDDQDERLESDKLEGYPEMDTFENVGGKRAREALKKIEGMK